MKRIFVIILNLILTVCIQNCLSESTTETTVSGTTTNVTPISEITTSGTSTSEITSGTTVSETTTNVTPISEITTSGTSTSGIISEITSGTTINETTTISGSTNSETTTTATSGTTISETTTVITTTTTPIFQLGSENYTWNPRSTEKIIIQCEEGYKIIATIVNCSINGTNQEYATIYSGKANETLLLTYNVSNTPSYFFNQNVLYANFTGTYASNLTVIFSKVGELLTTTTTELTSTTIYLPTPSVNDSAEIIVHLSGKNPDDYKNDETLISFRRMVSQMAQVYCQTNFNLQDSITIENIKIIEIQHCSPQWVKCDSCVEITFAVPINTKEPENFEGYQMNTQHLGLMWEIYSGDYLTDGFTTCEPKPIDKWINWQIIIAVIFTIIFLSMLLIIRHFTEKITKTEGRKKFAMSDKSPIVTFEERTSQISLPPHYLQDTPALFDNTYSIFNPGLGISNAAFESHGDEIQDDTESDTSDLEESGA